jgi:hypothetical protein
VSATNIGVHVLTPYKQLDKLLSLNFDNLGFIEALAPTVNDIERIVDKGAQIAKDISQVYLVSCGAGFDMMEALAYEAERIAGNHVF